MRSRFALILILGLLLIPTLIVNAQTSNGCDIDSFTISPDERSYSQGVSLELYGSSNCESVVFTLDDEFVGEVGSQSHFTTLQTSDLRPGTHVACFLGQDNGGWSGDPESSCKRILLRGSIDTDDIDLSDCPIDFTRFSIGDEVTVYDGDPSALPMRELPGTNQQVSKMIPIRNVLTVIDGPICANDWRWWLVEHGNDIGWVGEVGPQRLFNLIPPTCPPQFITLRTGDDIQVTEGLGNRVRSGAGLEYEITDSVFNGTTLNIIGRSICNDGWNWWPVEYGNQTGWIVGGDFRESWLEKSP